MRCSLRRRDEFAERRGDAVAPALREPAPPRGGALLRPLGAEVGLEPERAVAHDEAGFVGAVEQAGQRLERRCRWTRRGASSRAARGRPSRARGRAGSELGEQLRRRGDGRIGGLGGVPLEQAAVDLVDADEHGRRRGGEVGRGRDVPGGVRGQSRRDRGGHVHARRRTRPRAGGGRARPGVPARHPRAHRMRRAARARRAPSRRSRRRVRRRRPTRRRAPRDDGGRVGSGRGRPSRERAGPRRGRRGRARPPGRTRATAALSRDRFAAARGDVRRARARPRVSSIRCDRRAIVARRSR